MHTFRKNQRLLKPGDFVRVLKSGRKAQTKSFRVTVLPNGLGSDRLGISVSAKVAGSVQRSRVKRLLREYFRLNLGGDVGKGGNEGVGSVGFRGGVMGGTRGCIRRTGAGGVMGEALRKPRKEGAGNETVVESAPSVSQDIVISVKRIDTIKGLKDVERELAQVLSTRT